MKTSRDLIIVANAGSSTIKYAVYSHKNLVLNAVYERISAKYQLKIKIGENEASQSITRYTFQNSAKHFLQLLQDGELFDDPSEIEAIGYRVVHGGLEFVEPAVITKKVLTTLKKYNDIAPLHNPPAVKLIDQFHKALPDTPQVAVFDTGFHATIPEVQRIYGIPNSYTKRGIVKYGFHGISCASIIRQLRELYSHRTIPRVIICHLGSGASITAVRSGDSVDTSMGYTPLDGLLMMTRPGDLDPGVVLELMKQQSTKKTVNAAIKATEKILNKESGIKGITGGVSDMRDILKKAAKKDPKAELALTMFVDRIVGYIAKYYIRLGGCTSLVFTGGIGIGSDIVRKLIVKKLGALNIYIDDFKNVQNRLGRTINTRASQTDIWILEPKEAEQIMLEVRHLLK